MNEREQIPWKIRLQNFASFPHSIVIASKFCRCLNKEKKILPLWRIRTYQYKLGLGHLVYNLPWIYTNIHIGDIYTPRDISKIYQRRIYTRKNQNIVLVLAAMIIGLVRMESCICLVGLVGWLVGRADIYGQRVRERQKIWSLVTPNTLD